MCLEFIVLLLRSPEVDRFAILFVSGSSHFHITTVSFPDAQDTTMLSENFQIFVPRVLLSFANKTFASVRATVLDNVKVLC